MPAEYLQEREKTVVLIETKSASRMAAASSQDTVTSRAGGILLEQEKIQNATSKGLVRAGAEHHQAEPIAPNAGVCC